MLKLTLVTPEKRIFTGHEVKEVFVPGYEGELNILEGHAAFMSTLETGIFRYVDQEDRSVSVSISWGYCEINNDHITILAETAEKAENINLERAQDAYEKAQQKLEEAGLSISDIEKYQRKLQRADLRINIAQSARENN